MFGYIELLKALDTLDRDYKIEVIGKSLFGRDILAIMRGKAIALIHGGIHAREHITSKLTLELAKAYQNDNICFVPLVNPDGVELCIRGIDTAPSEYRDYLLNINGNNNDFALWKANGKGVDINVNFDADWGTGLQNKSYPSSSDYIGDYPFSESETTALRDYTLKNNFLITISYHSKGEIIYYGYGNNNCGETFVKKVADITGYRIAKSVGSAGGYKDWFCNIGENNIGLTIEVGEDSYDHPFPYNRFNDIMSKNKRVTELIDKELTNG